MRRFMKIVLIVLAVYFGVLLVGAFIPKEPPAHTAAEYGMSTEPASPALTPVAAGIMDACAKSVLAGARTLTMQHIAEIDTCTATARALLLQR